MKINWHNIKTANGNANNIPNAIKDLISIDKEVREKAYWRIDNHAVLQSDLYEAAFYIIEPIVEILEENIKSNKLLAIRILVEVAIGGNGHYPVEIIDNGNKSFIYLDDACKLKFKNLEERIKKINVITKEEEEELDFLLKSI